MFNPPSSARDTEGFADGIVNIYLGGFQRWDALYFTHIAENGYVYQNSLAFFPLYPWMVRLAANTVLFPFQFCMTYRSVLVVSAFVLNLCLFVEAAGLLYSLGKKTLGDAGIAYKAALLFCINPASIFMSAPYSETTFVFLMFLGLFQFEERNPVLANGIFSLAALTRSNGLLTAGFQLHRACRNFVQQLCRLLNIENMDKKASRTGVKAIFCIQAISLIFLMCIFFLPFIIYQCYIYNLYCKKNYNAAEIPYFLQMYGEMQNYHIIGEATPSWCANTLPLSYSYIQQYHWGVGFLQYYEMKQIPNFLLALPVTILSVSSVICYYRKNKDTFLTLGLIDVAPSKKEDRKHLEDYGFINRKLLPYVFHVLFLTVFGWLFMHIQVHLYAYALILFDRWKRTVFPSLPIIYSLNPNCFSW